MDWTALKDSTLIITAVCYGTLCTIALLAGLFGLWLLILLIPSLWRYGYSVARTVAQGHSNIEAPDLNSLNPISDIMLILHFVAFLAIIIGVSTYQTLGPIAAVAVLSIFPASTGVLVLTSSFEAAFRPAPVIGFMRSLGRDYIVLVFGCVGVAVAAALIQQLVIVQIGFFSLLLSSILETWAFLAIFALIGSSIHVHSLDFVIPGERVSEEAFQANQRELEWRKTLDLAYPPIRSGLVEEGYRILRQFIADNADSNEVRYWLFENMLEWEDKRHAVQIGRQLITREVKAENMVAALELYTRCSRVEGGVTVPAAAAAPLADHAESLGHHGLASELRASLQA